MNRIIPRPAVAVEQNRSIRKDGHFSPSKTIDRLVLVPDNGQTRLSREPLDDIGLNLTGVLKFVDQKGTPATTVIITDLI